MIFVGACWRLNIWIDEIRIRHRERFAGNTQVYKLAKTLGITFEIGLLILRFA
jgi:hypothetical protein